MFMLMPMSVFVDLGGFDERYRLYFEDVDFCWRLWQHGYKIGVVKAARVKQNAQQESHRKPIRLLQHVSNAVKLLWFSDYRRQLKNMRKR
jgi:GT2 family glycosyltransferase